MENSLPISAEEHIRKMLSFHDQSSGKFVLNSEIQTCITKLEEIVESAKNAEDPESLYELLTTDLEEQIQYLKSKI